MSQCSNSDDEKDVVGMKGCEFATNFCLQVESARLTSVVVQCLNEAIPAAPADAYFRSPSTSSAFYHDSSNLVQPSPASLMDHDSLSGYSLPALTPLHDFFEDS
jgi:hypothetical protein